MDLPICENYERNVCPKSDVRMLAEHGPPAAKYYTSFVCRTCRMMFIKWEPSMLERAKKQQLDKELGNLVNPRFRGYV